MMAKVKRIRQSPEGRILPGCPNLTDGRYCPEHQQKVNSNYEKYGRDPATKKRYGRAWKRIRNKYAAEHPFCELCFERGIIVETQEIHHKKPLSEGGTHDRGNLIALCKSCHSRIHAHRGDYWGARCPVDIGFAPTEAERRPIEGRGSRNPYSSGSYRTARGSRVQNREIESENPYAIVTKMVTQIKLP